MATVTLSVWRDTGYTEGTLEVPSKTSSLSSPTFIFTGLHPSRDKLFSEIQVPAPYENIYDCSYVRVVVDMNNGDDVTVYGWIDTVTASSDNPGNPMTIIRWHVDYWRTYLNKAVFKGGVVQRRKAGANDPPQKYPYKYTEYVDRYDVMIPSEYWFVIINFNVIKTEYVTTTGTNTTVDAAQKTSTTTIEQKTEKQVVTKTMWGCYPVSNISRGTGYTVGGGTGPAPSMNETLSGVFDEKLGLDPDAINSVFLSPVSPQLYTDAQTLRMTGWKVDTSICKGRCLVSDTANAFGLSYSRSLVSSGTKPLPNASKTDDINTYVLCDMQGYAIGTMPWGMEFSWLKYWLVASTELCYIRIALLKDSNQSLSSAVAEGRVFTSPCVTVGVSSNATSSYVYSGARTVEQEQRRLSTQQTMEQGVANTASSALQGGASGAMMGAIGGPIGILGGALLGGITSAAGNAISTTSQYVIGNKYNDKFNDLSDYAHAHQTSVNMLPSGSYDILNNGIAGYWLVKTKRDDYSIGIRADDIAMYGAHVSEPMSSTQSLINAGGPLQIANLTVTGPIPVEAKNYFRERFAGGVRIV